MMNIIGLFILVLICSTAYQFELETCRSPLGIETGKLPDTAFSSSSHLGPNAIASKARIRNDLDGWCPSSRISFNSSEYLEINLENLTVITLIELQGKSSSEPNDAFADAFQLEYRRDHGQKWIKYRDFSGQHILSGNTNSHIPTMRDILPSIIARQIRIFPLVVGLKPKEIVCLRLELYGCSYQDGPISYSIPQGDKRGYDVQFVDETYDGSKKNGTLRDGLGQLTDGVLGRDDYLLDENVQGIGSYGYDWIGWKKRSSMNNSVEIQFQFDTHRYFDSILLHASNLFSREIYLFNALVVGDCDDGNHLIRRTIPEDRINTHARFVNVSFKSDEKFIGKCLRIILTYHPRSRWILLSEIIIGSIPVSHTKTFFTTTGRVTSMDSFPSIDNEISLMDYWHWFLMGSCLLVVLIVLLTLMYSQWIQSNRHKNQIRKMTGNIKFDSSYQPISFKTPFRSPMTCCYTSNGESGSTIYERSSCSMSNNDIRHHLIVSTSTSMTSPSTSRGTNSSEFGTASPTTISTVYQSVINPYLTAVSKDSSNSTSNPYASIDMYTNPMSPLDSTETTDYSRISIEGPCGNSTFQALTNGQEPDGKVIERINDEQIIIEERYSTLDGRFGTIVRGYVFLRHPCDLLKPILIKVLRTNDINQRKRFEEEHQLWNRLKHPNLVQFFGYTLQQNYALIEYSNLGDLYTYLSKTQRAENESSILSLNARLLIVSQLTNALRYLESERIIHRDIAARNCLIYPNYEIKLTNCAFVSHEFHSHYFMVDENCRLPIRWMAPETLANNEFTSQSDVWSFGITLWEIMTNCFTLPYALLNDEQVFNRLHLMGTNLVHSSGSLQLSKPEYLSKELVDLMLECWRPWGERPTFHEIFTFFNKRLDGINVA